MFEKVSSLKLKSNACAFNNGLIYYHEKQQNLHMIGCLDVDMVNLTKYRLNSEQSIELVECTQAKINPIDEFGQFCLIEFHYFKFLEFNLFCLISSSGLHIYDDNKFSRPIFTYSIKSSAELLSIPNPSELTFNGLSCLDSLLYMGTSTGVVLVFDIVIIEAKEENGLREKSTTFRFREFLKQHLYSITFISARTDLVKDANNQNIKVHRLAISDALGNVSIWHFDSNQLKYIFQFSGFNNYHCVSTKFYEDLLIACYSSGHIRLFSLIDKCLLCEVSAHAKPITSMNISETGLLITTSEDTVVRIWMLRPDADSYVKWLKILLSLHMMRMRHSFSSDHQQFDHIINLSYIHHIDFSYSFKWLGNF